MLVALGNDVDDDGTAHDGGDGIEGDDARLARQEADGIADEGNDGSAEHGAWHQYAVVGSAKQQVGNVRNGQANEHDGAAEGCGYGG